MVRPESRGWAQINGATLLSPDEKDKLDEWYILNASLWLDFAYHLHDPPGRGRTETAVNAR